MSLTTVQNAPRPATICEANEAIIDVSQQARLLNLVSGTESFVCSVRSGIGRTIYLPPEGTNNLPGLKIKGGGGFQKKDSEPLAFYSPRPKERYAKAIGHTHIDGGLNFVKQNSAAKALNSLRAEQARMEYVAQTRLRVHNLGFAGICWGKFVGETDLNRCETGFTISELDPTYQPLSGILQRSKNGGYISHDTLSDRQLEFYLHMTRRIGTIKRDMREKACLGRHSSTLANFLYSEDEDRLMVTDTDTVIDCSDLDDERSGAQFLRDTVSDLCKRLFVLRFSEPSPKVSEISEQVMIEFLVGLFGDTLSERIIQQAVKDLNLDSQVEGSMSRNTTGLTYFISVRPALYQMVYELILKTDLPDQFPIQMLRGSAVYDRARRFYIENNIL